VDNSIRSCPGIVLDGDEFNRLQAVYEQACATLKLGLGDPRREALAAIIFDLNTDPKGLHDRAVALYRQRQQG
jgi:hypothetical protein